MRFPPRFLEDLKSRVSIYDYAGRRIAWDRRKSRPSAGDYWAPCPFHSEKTASFHVLERQGSYKCFGCGEAGDVFGLCMQLDGVSFPEAVAQIAAFAGVPLPETDAGASPEQTDQRARHFQALEKAAAFYQARLRGGMGAAARAYLLKRGLPEGEWARFGLGFAPDGWSTTFDALTAAGLRADDLIAVGLAKQGQRGPIDVFRNRIIFPIADTQGRVVAFGGRAMDPSDPAKYLNSPETPLFHKGRTLYRLVEARRTEAKKKLGGLIVAEGYMDVIAFERAGLPAVAPLGTALTEDQLQLTWRSGASPILCFDGDKAGQRAAERSLDIALPFLSPDRTIRFAVLPDGADPDDIFAEHGAAGLEAALQAAVPASRFLVQREVARQPLTTPEARAGLKRRLKDACGRITDDDTKASYFKDLLAQADRAIRDSERGAPTPGAPPSPQRGKPASTPWRRPDQSPRLSQELVATGGKALSDPITHILRIATDNPHLLDHGADQLAALPIQDSALDAVRHALLDLWSAGGVVDRGALSRHLHSRQEDRAQSRVLLWPPPVAPRRPRSRELDVLEPGDPPPATAPAARALPAPAEPEGAAIEAEWMALIDHYKALPTLVEDLQAAKAAALSGEDPDAFARWFAMQQARRRADQAAQANGGVVETADDTDEEPNSDPSQSAA